MYNNGMTGAPNHRFTTDEATYLRRLWSSRVALGTSVVLAGVATVFAWLDVRDAHRASSESGRRRPPRRLGFDVGEAALTF